MPGYVLDGAGWVELPRRPLAVTVDATGTSVEVWAFGPDGTESRDVLNPLPGLMILPRVNTDTVVVARPAGQEEFPQGTVLYVTIGVDSERDPDPERAELTPIDVSGLYSVELASVAPAEDRVVVTARKTAVDVVLDELAARARSAARGVLRVDRLPEARRVRVELDIDTTISMLPRIEDRSIRAVADVVAGIAAVVGVGDSVQVNLIGRSVTTLPTGELRDLGDRVQTALDSASLGVGFRSAAVDRSSQTEPALVVSLSDAAPADRIGNGDAASPVRRHHVVLSARPTEPVAGITTVTPPGAGVEAAASLVADTARLRRLVESLISDFAAVRDSEGESR
ncbi:hypothetical protein A5N78_18950 [Prescottella equi]|uniref:Uncharacterized protein n=1 Tax=Prescottella equi ATCC 33707 TaxID=525370 RepID=E9SXP9_RHOHA|nr:hypothetical protein [Prescottella equi]AVP68100.1 hypothetical protein C7H75_09160 [Prescottella equi]EGD25333.1 hypothetical protein HMPREF0724_11114 [Prescottella equi ATCC 33707]MBM4732608.1 hypothetical protein [Prescottella equi]NKR97103.1 hypothetical protein [Prescottella equi]NKZ79424.1 hypothetical protein [Prescottella equi]